MTTRTLFPRGLTLLETLLAMTIAAILMVAVGTALVAGSKSVSANQDFAHVTRMAQIALQNISTAARTSYLCDVESGAPANTSTAESNVLYVTRFGSSGAGAKVAYIYDAARQTLLLDTTPPNAPITTTSLSSIRTRMNGAGATVFALARQIRSCSFVGFYSARDTDEFGGTETRLVNLKIHLVVNSGTDALDMSESVVPRTSHQQ